MVAFSKNCLDFGLVATAVVSLLVRAQWCVPSPFAQEEK